MTAEIPTRHGRPCVALSTPDWPRGASPNGIVTYTAELEAALRERGARPVILSWHVEPTAGVVANEKGEVHDEVVDISQFQPQRTLLNRVIQKAGRTVGSDTLLKTRLSMIERAVRAAVTRFPIELIEIEEALGLAMPVIRSGLVPVVVRLHGPWFLNGRALGVKEDAAFERRNRLEREVIALADAVTAPSRDVLERTRAHYQLPLDHGRVVLPPVDCSRERALWSLADCDRNRIVFVGRFDLHKGADVMIDAFNLLATDRPELTLDFIGPDRGILTQAGEHMHLAQYLATHVSNADVRRRIVVHGQQTPDALATFRRRGLVTVVPSRYETFGYTAVEALTLSCPVIAANSGGLAEIVRDRETGLLFDSGEPRSLAGQIAKFVDAPEWAAQFGEAGRKDIATRYAPRSIAEQTLETYASVLKRRRERAARGAQRPRANA
jgi:glycosyltransferase involved in cell wall biosynthesis